MDMQTCAYYLENPHQRVVNDQLLQEMALLYTRSGSRVLEVACGSGWLSRHLSGTGRLVTACDLVDPAPGEGISSCTASFPLKDSHKLLAQEPFDALLCVAMLMHLPDSSLWKTLSQFRVLLAEGGHLMISVCHGGRMLDGEGHDERGVFYSERPLAEYELLLERLGFMTVERRLSVPDGLGRAGIMWDVWVGVAHQGAHGHGVDHAMGLIHRDSKTATYKLALLRALTDVAQDRPHKAVWGHDGRVGIPFDDLVELWIRYYSPLLAADIPQIQRGMRMGFSKEWERTKDWRLQERLLDRPLRRMVESTIRKGPAMYSKGVADGALFQAGSKDGLLWLPGDLWKELTLIGHWIRDSLLLEWARQSAAFSVAKPEARVYKMAEHLAVLLTDEEGMRYTDEARVLYAGARESCVWTGSAIHGDMHVDHLIPFSQWATNAWWNLLPSSSRANLSKSDKLPTLGLLDTCKERIKHCWRLASEHAASTFETEIRRDYLGEQSLANWEAVLFDALCGRIEMMGESRGLMRWNGL